MPQPARFMLVRRADGYLPLEDHGLIGDGTTAALVGRDGAVSWLCLPRFDSPPVFCRILDTTRGGAFTIVPEDLMEARQFYESGTAVLVTEMRSRSGLVQVTDALTLRSGADLTEDRSAGRGELLRTVMVLEGRVRLRVEIVSRGGDEPERKGDVFLFRRSDRREYDLELSALCQVALDRAARLAQRFNLSGDAQGWQAAAEHIRRDIIEKAWDSRLNSLTEHLGGGRLDASLLALPLRRVIPADHPRMIATTAAICHYLGAGQGLLYRYLPRESPDGLPGHEGAFLLCSFWLVDNLAKQGRVDEAMELYDSLCSRAGTLGLLPEQIDPATGAFLGNYPQAFSHIGVISSGVNLARLLEKGENKAHL